MERNWLGPLMVCCTVFGAVLMETTTPCVYEGTLQTDQDSKESNNLCVMEGKVNVSENWYGFLANVSLVAGGGFRFAFSYPLSQGLLSVVLYNDEDIEKLVATDLSCWQMQGVIAIGHIEDQTIHLGSRYYWNGCVALSSNIGEPYMECNGERTYETARNIYFAVMNCRSIIGLYLEYRLEFFGYQGRPSSRV